VGGSGAASRERKDGRKRYFQANKNRVCVQLHLLRNVGMDGSGKALASLFAPQNDDWNGFMGDASKESLWLVVP
jgi:hypothetical protein